MRCTICNKEIFYNLSFKDLFIFDFLCPICSKLIKPKLITIPIDNGHVINYYYFLKENEYLEYIEYKVYPEIFRLIRENKNKSTILFLDDDTILFLKFLNFNEDITLISIVYEDFTYIFDE